jgi:hypothetical protein
MPDRSRIYYTKLGSKAPSIARNLHPVADFGYLRSLTLRGRGGDGKTRQPITDNLFEQMTY